MKNKTIIGLEVHIELSTKSKMFCGCSAEHFAKEPNTQTCPVCLGLPGALPYANSSAIESIIKLGLALGCEISEFSKFDRKHYSYPDLPKGYQISQYDLPICKTGIWKKINITRIHMEEDTGKLIHKQSKNVSLIDFNRSGVPLVELVTEPDFETPEEVDEFLRELQLIIRYLKISTADMEKGSLRLEANISLQKPGETKLPDYKVELKNINSFKFLKKAILIEINRQQKLLDNNEKIIQETRGYDSKKNITFSQRSKEESADYRYMPEPDIPPLIITKENILNLKNNLPELPLQKRERLTSEYKISEEYVNIFIQNNTRADYFEEAVKLAIKQNISAKMIAGVMINQHLDKKYKTPASLIKKLITLSKKQYATNEETENAANLIIKNNTDAVKSYKNGNEKIIGFLIGQVQKELQGHGEVKTIRDLLAKLLN